MRDGTRLCSNCKRASSRSMTGGYCRKCATSWVALRRAFERNDRAAVEDVLRRALSEVYALGFKAGIGAAHEEAERKAS